MIFAPLDRLPEEEREAAMGADPTPLTATEIGMICRALDAHRAKLDKVVSEAVEALEYAAKVVPIVDEHTKDGHVRITDLIRRLKEESNA